jgi:hypothetical protein
MYLSRVLERVTTALHRRSIPGKHSRAGLAKQHNQPPRSAQRHAEEAPPHTHRDQGRRPTRGAAVLPRVGRSPAQRGGVLVSGLKTGITIAVYSVNRDTGERQEIKPEQHYHGEKLTSWNLARHRYEPCLCPQCKENNS